MAFAESCLEPGEELAQTLGLIGFISSFRLLDAVVDIALDDTCSIGRTQKHAAVSRCNCFGQILVFRDDLDFVLAELAAVQAGYPWLSRSRAGGSILFTGLHGSIPRAKFATASFSTP